VIRGWANYHRHSCSKNAFYYIDSCIFKNLWRWVKRRHPNKKAQWIRNRYFRTIGNRNWCFFATQKMEGGEAKVIDLLYMGTVKIMRHTKVRANANPYDKRWQDYFSKRSIGSNYSAIEPALCC
jgi:RNA-directed DNA polymerase